MLTHFASIGRAQVTSVWHATEATSYSNVPHARCMRQSARNSEAGKGHNAAEAIGSKVRAPLCELQWNTGASNGRPQATEEHQRGAARQGDTA